MADAHLYTLTDLRRFHVENWEQVLESLTIKRDALREKQIIQEAALSELMANTLCTQQEHTTFVRVQTCRYQARAAWDRKWADIKIFMHAVANTARASACREDAWIGQAVSVTYQTEKL